MATPLLKFPLKFPLGVQDSAPPATSIVPKVITQFRVRRSG